MSPGWTHEIPEPRVGVEPMACCQTISLTISLISQQTNYVCDRLRRAPILRLFPVAALDDITMSQSAFLGSPRLLRQ